jgi:hypothetical protein
MAYLTQVLVVVAVVVEALLTGKLFLSQGVVPTRLLWVVEERVIKAPVAVEVLAEPLQL